MLVGGFALALGEPYRAAVAGALREACWDIGQDWDAMVLLGTPDEDSALYGGAYVASRARQS
jgi:glucokinase